MTVPARILAVLVAASCGCAPTGSSHEDEPPPPVASSSPRPSAPPPRAPIPPGCPFLDPEPVGPSVAEGDAFDAIAFTLGMEPGRPRPSWIQPARPPASVTDAPFYLAMTEARLRWCFVDPDSGFGSAACDGGPGLRSFTGPPPASTTNMATALRSAQAAALGDRAVRVFPGAMLARRCTPAPDDVLARIEPPRWRSTTDGLVLEFVEQLHPRPDLARLVHVRLRPFADGTEVKRTELYSWIPKEAS